MPHGAYQVEVRIAANPHGEAAFYFIAPMLDHAHVRQTIQIVGFDALELLPTQIQRDEGILAERNGDADAIRFLSNERKQIPRRIYRTGERCHA